MSSSSSPVSVSCVCECILFFFLLLRVSVFVICNICVVFDFFLWLFDVLCAFLCASALLPHSREPLPRSPPTCRCVDRVLLVDHPLRSLTYSNRHRVFFFFLTCSAARVAVSKTSRTPSFDLAEHSRYANALIFSAIERPSCGLTGSCFILDSSCIFGKSVFVCKYIFFQRTPFRATHLYRIRIISQIFLVAHQNDRHVRTEMFDL